MAEVSKGGVTTAGKSAKAAGPKMGDPDGLRKALADEAAGQSDEVVFVGNADHLHLRPPKPIYDAKGQHVGQDAGVFIDFQGVGRTRGFNPNVADDAKYIEDVREIIAQKPAHPDVYRLQIRELKPDEPAPPFARWDEYSADHIKVWVEANLDGDAERTARVVKECARYEAANQNRDDVLATLASLLVADAKVTDAFATAIKF